ncbi:MAG TPA: hypothetical protein VNN76_00010 [Bacteroidota bacterium]|nr:hypothetical protein [Bacteroidota bacterium]
MRPTYNPFTCLILAGYFCLTGCYSRSTITALDDVHDQTLYVETQNGTAIRIDSLASTNHNRISGKGFYVKSKHQFSGSIVLDTVASIQIRRFDAEKTALLVGIAVGVPLTIAFVKMVSDMSLSIGPTNIRHPMF